MLQLRQPKAALEKRVGFDAWQKGAQQPGRHSSITRHMGCCPANSTLATVLLSPSHLDIWLVQHTLQVLDTGTVVHLVQDDNLQAGSKWSSVAALHHRLALVCYVQPTHGGVTLYSG